MYLGLISALLLTSCGLIKKTSATTSNTSIETSCPEKGTCTVVRFKDKALVVTENENQNIGYEMVDKKGSYVIQYTYEKQSSGKYQDDFHTERVLFQLEGASLKKEWKAADLQQVTLLFERYCYCKGSAGVFKITEGTLSVQHSAKETAVCLQFKAPVPQLFENLKFKAQ